MRNYFAGLLLATLTLTTGAGYAQTPRSPAQHHEAVLAQFGGELADRPLQAYVDDVGAKLLRAADTRGAKIGFTLLDSPQINAFASPFGEIYLTRGILGLANDEAELAAVMAHEIAHLTESHLQDRQDAGKDALRSGLLGAVVGGIFGKGDDVLGNALKSGIEAALGYMGQFSQEQEYEADIVGVAILAGAGYDPRAQADFLQHLSDQNALDSRIAGKEYNPNQVSFFATHPATGDRIRRAERAAEQARARGGNRFDDRYLDHIDGLIYGDVAAQGFVRGRDFLHPLLRIGFRVPEGFVIANTERAVEARNPDGATLTFSGDRLWSRGLSDYISRRWAPQIARGNRAGPIQDLHPLTINGLPAATGWMQLSGRRDLALQLTAIEAHGRIYRFATAAPVGDTGARRALEQAAASFRTLEPWQAELLRPYRIRVVQVRRGDSAETLARRMGFEAYRLDRFLTLNGLPSGVRLQPGQRVKIVEE